MSAALPFGKFFWSDYSSDPALKICSFAAQGLWMRMLCIAAEHDPVGYVAVNGRGLDPTSIARATGGFIEEVEQLLDELDGNGVFSRDRRGWIYSRRMIRDAKKARKARETGKLGGNPSLIKQKENPASDNPKEKGQLKTHIPETRDQKEKTLTGKKPFPDAWRPEQFGEGSKSRTIVDGWPDGIEAEQVERFRAHHRKEGSRFVDWQSAWSTWVLNSVAFAARPSRFPSSQSAGPDQRYLDHMIEDRRLRDEWQRRNGDPPAAATG